MGIRRKVIFSLRAKIITLIFSLIIITMGVVFSYTINMNLTIQQKQVKKNARKAAESLSALRLVTSWKTSDVDWNVYDKYMSILSRLDRDILLMAILDEKKQIKASSINRDLINKSFKEIKSIKSDKKFSEYLITNKISDSLKIEMPITVKGSSFAAVVIKFSKKSYNRRMNIMILNMVILTVILLGAGFGGAWGLAHLITNNFNIIASGMRKVATGNLDVEVEVKTNDETGVLADDFNRMLVELKEKVRIKDAFESVADGLKEMDDLKKAYEVLTYQEMTDKITKGYYPPSVENGVKTVFAFIDITSFSAFTFELISEELKDIIKRFIEKVSSTVLEYQGAVIKVTDKFVLLSFGYPFAHEDDMKRALISIVEIRKELVGLVKSKLTLGYNVEEFYLNFVVVRGSMTDNFVDKKSHDIYSGIIDYLGFASKYGEKKKYGTDVFTSREIASGTSNLANFDKVDNVNMNDGTVLELYKLKGTKF